MNPPNPSKLTVRDATPDEITSWDQLLIACSHPHFLQTHVWAEFKQQHSFSPIFLILESPADRIPLLVLKRTILGKALLYVPKGPAFNWSHEDAASQLNAILQYLTSNLVPREQAFLLKVESECPADNQTIKIVFAKHGFNPSTSHPNFRRTVWINLQRSPDDLLNSFKSKTRYNIRLAQKKNLTITRSNDPSELHTFYELHRDTGKRQHFPVRAWEYYRSLWSELAKHNLLQLLMARDGDELLGGVLLWRFGDRAYYQYGASSTTGRDKMATYLLQWEAMRWAQENDIFIYDMVGLPHTKDPKDPFYGVQRFKEGFCGEVREMLGAMDYSPSAMTKQLWPRLEPLMKRALWYLKRDVLY